MLKKSEIEQKDRRAERLRVAALNILVADIKSVTPFGDSKHLRKTFEQYGFCGPFTGLEKFFNNTEEMLQSIKEAWPIR